MVILSGQITTGLGKFLAEAESSLARAIAAKSSRGAGPAYPRSALLHATFLVQACLRRGDLDRVVAVMRTALGLLPQVRSPRARSYLFGSRPEFARRARSPVVRDLLDEFDQASSVM